ncbi:AT-hook motif nuclear-localized protein 7-like [Corylus avellana]|uniref:AT-hook motif nuclear-localized protein 7-like n=1 Tax=Corylus avellana TaxID=13451 RepID=UPI00286B60B2|nr:AT-hook motif nuclear-localized protein 7-like [Corylus avellana]
MEAREGISSGVTVIGAEAPSAYHVAPRSENNPSQNQPAGAPAVTAASPVSVGLAGTTGKKKRGRPRKYNPDGAVTMALSPMPISSSAPPGGDFSVTKRGKVRPSGLEYKQHKKVAMEHFGEFNACSVGTNFMPHIITVNAGEDVTMKVISFSQQGPRAICILSANGVISNVTLRQPDSSGGTLTYEGRFEILSLSGSFIPTETQGTRSRSGGMSVSLASPDGRVVGGGVAGLLVAASPVQVVVGSFLPSNQPEQKPKKQKNESNPAIVTPATTVATVVPAFNAENEESLGGNGQQNSSTPRPSLASSSTFRRENWAILHSVQDSSRNSGTDINISLPGG